MLTIILILDAFCYDLIPYSYLCTKVYVSSVVRMYNLLFKWKIFAHQLKLVSSWKFPQGGSSISNWSNVTQTKDLYMSYFLLTTGDNCIEKVLPLGLQSYWNKTSYFVTLIHVKSMANIIVLLFMYYSCAI